MAAKSSACQPIGPTTHRGSLTIRTAVVPAHADDDDAMRIEQTLAVMTLATYLTAAAAERRIAA